MRRTKAELIEALNQANKNEADLMAENEELKDKTGVKIDGCTINNAVRPSKRQIEGVIAIANALKENAAALSIAAESLKCVTTDDAIGILVYGK